jgi:cytohesin
MAGADVTAKDNDLGMTLLYWAAVSGYASAVEVLLKAVADPKAKANDSITPPHGAGLDGSATPAEVLLRAGANPNARDNKGSTPLHQAAFGLSCWECR